jgi:hypothetical protein
MLLVEDKDHFVAVVAFAQRIGLYDPVQAQGAPACSLKSRLDYLEGYGGKNEAGEDTSRVRLFKDWSPYSFGFVIERRGQDGCWKHFMNGGLLYHGAHDGNGSGAAPTFAVTLTPTSGWSIHT